MSGPAVPRTSIGPEYYGESQQLIQLAKYVNRDNNNWRYRIRLFHELLRRYALPRLDNEDASAPRVVDIGCSIGTFALEAARVGLPATGVDFDPAAIRIAQQLALDEGLDVAFVCGDVCDPEVFDSTVDIAIAFDLFEHLQDDELGCLLTAIRRNLSDSGTLLFHTAPTEYHYLFISRWLRTMPLLPISCLPSPTFERTTRAYAAALDACRLLVKGTTVREAHSTRPHCNPLTEARLRRLLGRAGYSVLCLGTAPLYSPSPFRSSWFSRQPIAHQNLFGAAAPKAH